MLISKLFNIVRQAIFHLKPDGFRGEANVTLTSMQAYKVGRFLGWYFSSKLSGCTKSGYRPRIVIGKDTRRSSYMLEYSIVSGIIASGADVGCGSVINPGTIIGKNTSVYPLTSLRGVYPSECIIKATNVIVEKL